MATKEKYSQDEVATLLGFAKLNAAYKLLQFWKWVQASNKSRGGVTDTYRNIILEDMKKWAWDNRRDFNKGVYLKKKTINSMISLCFNPGGCVAQFSLAEQGIFILVFQAHSKQEIETLKVQELAKERIVAMRSYKEALKIAKTTVCAPTSTYQDIKLNISTFCAFVWTLFGDGCNYYAEVFKVLRILGWKMSMPCAKPIPQRYAARLFEQSENILCGYLYDGDLVFVILRGIYGFKFPKRFLEISSRDLTSYLLFCQS